MDCSIVGPLKLPSVTCGDFLFFNFLTSKQGTKAKSCFHLNTPNASNSRKHEGICATKDTQMHTDIQTSTHIQSKPNWKRQLWVFWYFLWGGWGASLVYCLDCRVKSCTIILYENMKCLLDKTKWEDPSTERMERYSESDLVQLNLLNLREFYICCFWSDSLTLTHF